MARHTSSRYRELTPASLLLGVLVGAVLNMGIVYAGLQIGFTIVGSTVAAVLGFGLLRGLLRRGTILEVNVFQTVASAVNTVNAGVIFTVPVLFLLGREQEIHIPALVLACVAGSTLGVMLIIPLRKQIIEYERLRFPEGVAVATILKSPGAGIRKSVLLLSGVLLSAGVVALTKDWFGPPALADTLPAGSWLDLPAAFRLTLAVSPLSLGAGFLAGRGGLAVLYGTILNYWILIPLCIALGWVPAGFSDFGLASRDFDLAEEFTAAFSHFTSRHVGIGMILGGAVAGILIAAPALRAALASLRTPPEAGGEPEEVAPPILGGGLVLGLAMLFLAAKLSGGEHLGWGTALLVTLAGGAWLALAGLVVAQTTGRTDWSPLSGLALIAIAIMMGIMGTGDEYVIPAVTLGASVCVATSMCADMMADLKTGHLVGSRPYRQQIAQILTCWIGPGIALAAVLLLWRAYGFGPDQARIVYERQVEAGTVAEYLAAGGTQDRLRPGIPALGAPQAGALQSAIQIVQSGDVPLGKYVGGAVLGLVVSLLVSPGLGVMVGLSLYLPFDYMIVFGLGGILSLVLARWKGRRWSEENGVPLAAGLIVGDALVGISDALQKVLLSLG